MDYTETKLYLGNRNKCPLAMTSDGISSKSNFSPVRHFVLKCFKLVSFG